MSARTHFVSITSIVPIRDAVASKDRALVDAVMALYAERSRGEDGEDEEDEEFEDEDLEEDQDEFREFAEGMILCKSPPKKEPGCWNYVIKLLAGHFELEPDEDLPFNDDWKHYQVWEEYRRLVKKHITAQADRYLGYLEDGRPLKGSKIDHDGCVFAWLTTDEVSELHESLSKLGPAVITDEDLADFHEGLVESLKVIADREAVLFMAAH